MLNQYHFLPHFILCYVYFNVKLTLFKVLGNISIYLEISIYNDMYKNIQFSLLALLPIYIVNANLP